MKDKVFIRADGSAEIGLGHLVRCVALAHMLKENYSIHFFSKEIPSSFSEKIKKEGFSIKAINSEEEFLSLLSGDQIVILDNYKLGSGYQKMVKKKGNMLVCIDDLQRGIFYSDLIINHAPGISEEKYRAQDYTRFALGLDYALLRPSFLKEVVQDNSTGKIKNVFVCFGGSDPNNLTLKTIKILINHPEVKQISIVTGASYGHIGDLEELCGEIKNINWQQNVDEEELIQIMKDSDLAIVPCSGIMIESMACGLEIITCYYVDNQKLFYDNILNLEKVIGVGKVNKGYSTRLKDALTKKLLQKRNNLSKADNPFRNSKKNILQKFNELRS